MKILFVFTIIFLCLSCNSQVSVLPNDADILYTGRFSMHDVMNPSFSMNGTSIKINFTGTQISGRFSNKGKTSFLYIILDEQASPFERKIVEVQGANESEYLLAENLPDGLHTLEIVKLNESESKVTFHGFIIEGTGLTAKPKRPPLQLEFIGDSNTAGWSAWDAYDNGGGQVSGAYFTFPGITSRLLNAEYSLIGGSGSGIADRTTWNLTKFYNLIHIADEPSSNNSWNFAENYWNFQPSAVIVNLGANDYYAQTPKQEIKDGWKDFINNKLRVYYPKTHIVLVNSYGWAYNEPADYVHEAIDELHKEGETKVSFVRFPWLWGQTHAVINEHAGFANIMANHLAEVLNLEKPGPTDLSSFVPKGELYNGSFEKSILSGIADGWRPNGKANLIHNPDQALDGEYCLRLEKGAWANFATEVEIGAELTLTGWAKGEKDTDSGFFKIEFKDQAQKTIKTQQIQPDLTTSWREFSTSSKVPEGTWSAWIVLAVTDNSRVDFDDIQLEMKTAMNEPTTGSNTEIKIFPNPTNDFLTISSDFPDHCIEVFTPNGSLVKSMSSANQIDVRSWQAGTYFLRILEAGYLAKFVKF